MSYATNHSILTKQAVAAAIAVTADYGIQVENPRILADAYSVRIHLDPAPIVARVSTLTALIRTPIEDWLAREISVAEFLVSRGAPVVPPSDRLPAIPHQRDGLFMTFWQYIQPVSDRVPDFKTVGQMLGELHTVLRDYGGNLPIFAPPLNDIPRGLERLKQTGNTLTDNDLTLLQQTYDRLLPHLHKSSDQLQPLHGDAHASNLIPTAEGWLWNDFEDTCSGHITWDLINLDDEGRAAYPSAPEAPELEPYIQLRQLHVIVWVYALLPEYPNWAEPAKAMLDNLRKVSWN